MIATVNRIYAYYEDLDDPQQWRIAQLWVANWKDHGWQPEVLGVKEARAHPGHDAYVKAVGALPTVNHKGYEVAAFRRYLAFARVSGGPFAVADYDVFPRVALWPPKPFPVGYIGDVSGGPGFMVGDGAFFQSVVELFQGYRPDDRDVVAWPGQAPRAHVSDMSILQRTALHAGGDPNLVYYTHPRWEEHPLTHFSVNFIPRERHFAFLVQFLENLSGKRYTV